MADLKLQGELSMDTSQGEASVDKFGKSANKMAREVSDAAKKAGDSVGGIGDKMDFSAEKINRQERSITASIKRTTTQFEQLGKTASQKLEMKIVAQGLDPAKFEPALAKLRDLEAQAKRVASASDDMGKSFKGAGADASSMADVLRSITTGGIAAFLGGAVVQSAMSAAKALYAASAAGENLKTMLDFASGGNGAKEIDFLRNVTDKLGLSFASTAKAYGGFAAAAKGTALEGEKARNIFEAVSKAAAVMGLSADESSGALLALQQMISKGTVQSEELRGQLGERLPGAFQIAAKAMGVTTAELGKMLEAGEVIADDFLPKFAKALEENLGGAAEKAADRLDAAVNRFDNAFERLKQTAGDSGASKAMSNELSALSRDLIAVSDTMESVRASGGGMWAELGSGAGVAVARTGFSTVNLLANTLNGTINALTGSAFGLRTDLALLPDVFKTSGQQAVAMADNLKRAEAEFAALRAQSDKQGSNIYIQSELFQLSQYIKKLREAQGAKADLTGTNPRDIPVTMTRGASYARYEVEQEAATKALNAERMKGAGVNKEYVASIKVYQDALRAGLITEKEAVKSIGLLTKKQYEASDAGKAAHKASGEGASAAKKAIAEQNKEMGEQAKLLAGLSGLTGSFAEDWSRLNVIYKSGKLSLEGLTKAQADLLAKQPAIKAANDAEAKAIKELQDLRNKEISGQENAILGLEAKALAMEDEVRMYGMGKEAIEALSIARLQERIDILAGFGNSAEQIALIEKEIDARKRLAVATDGKTRLDEGVRAAKAAEAEWKKTADSIENSLTDALLRGFESGKEFGKNLRDTLVNMFKTLVLRPIISAVMSPVSAAIGSTLGLSGAANAASGGASSLSGISNLYSAASSIAAVGSQVVSGTMSLANALGTIGANATGTGISGLLATNGAYGTAAAGTAGGLAGGVSAAIAAIPGWGWAALAAAAAYSLLSGKKDVRNGGGYTINAGQAQAVYGGGPDKSFTGDAAIAGAITATSDSISQLFKSVGSAAVLATYYGASETSNKGRGGVMSGGALASGVRFGEDGTGSNYDGTYFEKSSTQSPDGAAAAANLATDLKQSIVQALQAADDLPKVIAALVKGVDAEALTDAAVSSLLTTIEAVVTGINGFRAVALTLPFDALKSLSFDAAAGLMAAAGGLDALGANLTTYYDNFYSGEEKRAQTIKNINAATAGSGLDAATATRESFRALVESQDLTTEAGQKTYAALLGVSGAFAGITPVIESVATVVDTVTASISDAMKSMQADAANLQIEIMRKTGNAGGADAAQRALDTTGYGAAEVAMYDYVAGLRAQVAALDAATAAAEASAQVQAAIASERAGLDQQLLQLQGDTAALRAIERAKLDESNRATYDRINALQDEQAAAAAAAQAATVAAAAVAAAAQAATAAARAALTAGRDQASAALAGMIALYGDLAGAMLEISKPAATLVGQWRASTGELVTLAQGLADALGELPEATALDRLKSTMSTLASATAGMAGISEQIFGLQTGKGDSAAVGLLQAREASLYAQMATSADPGTIAGQLATTTLNRIKLQGQLADKAINDAYRGQFDAATELARLDKLNRDTQITAIQAQISSAQTLADVAASMGGYLANLRFGDLSALNPGEQLGVAQGLYAGTLTSAQGGDSKAMQALQGNASSYLQEAQGYYGGATGQYAAIFSTVTGALEQFGSTPVSDIVLMQDQLAALQAIQDASLTLQTTVTDTTDQQIAGLTNINLALTGRETQARQDAADAKAAAQKQIDLLTQAVAELKAQIVTQAAIYKAQQEKLESIDKSLKSLDDTSKQTAAAPV